MADRDHQRRRVYLWEDKIIAPCDPGRIPFADTQGMVDAIWSELGLRYPPMVQPLPVQARARLADASRLVLRLPALIPSWCLLHELAHVTTSDHDGSSDGHGPRFVGIYVQLLVRYMRLDQAWLLGTIERAGIQVDLQARPLFLDAAPQLHLLPSSATEPA